MLLCIFYVPPGESGEHWFRGHRRWQPPSDSGTDLDHHPEVPDPGHPAGRRVHGDEVGQGGSAALVPEEDCWVGL